MKEFVQILLISMSWFVVDSDLMMSVPSKFTAYQDMDAFFHASETVVNINHHPMAEMFALKTIEYVAKYLPRAVKDGNEKEARAYMALANTFAGYYMMYTSAHTMEHAMGSFHDKLVHGAGLIEIAHAYYDFFAERKASQEKENKQHDKNWLYCNRGVTIISYQ